MSLINGSQPLELRDHAGKTVGYVISDADFRERAALREENKRLTGALNEITEERDKLRADRENYAKILEVWERDGVAPFTRKELNQLRNHSVPFKDVVEEVEEMLRSRGKGA